MNASTQDAIERLGRDHNFKLFLSYIKERQDVYLKSLSTIDPDPVTVARCQGQVLGFEEVLNAHQDAMDEKRKRTGHG